MEKYFRTKRHVYRRYFDERYIMNEDGGGVTSDLENLTALNEETIAESDDVKDLCDEFIGVNDKGEIYLVEKFSNAWVLKNTIVVASNCGIEQGDIFGAIWVGDKDNGFKLITVAKQDAEGKFEAI